MIQHDCSCLAKINCRNASQKIKCGTCGEIFDCSQPQGCKVDRQWPKWAKLIAKRRYHCEIGVGSTVQRIAAKRGGEMFKRITKRLGIPCGCTERQERWNREFPYTPSQ